MQIPPSKAQGCEISQIKLSLNKFISLEHNDATSTNLKISYEPLKLFSEKNSCELSPV